jgi:hypothetical protein
VYEWDPAELKLAEKGLRRVSEKGPHEECGFRLTCGLEQLLLHEGERGTSVPLDLCTWFAYAIVLMVGTQLLLLWLNVQASTCHGPFIGMQNTLSVACSLLERRGRCPLGCGNSDAN